MASPIPMSCLKDECPTPMACNAMFGCREARRDGMLSYTLALNVCRERGVVPKSWEREKNDG